MTSIHTKQTLESLKKIEERKKKLFTLGETMMSVDNSNMYPVDLLAFGAIKRTLVTAAGFKLLVESFNMGCARSLLRTQIDTALRFYAIFLVEKPHDFASKVIDGKQINHIKDKKGNKLYDGYLARALSKEYPWLHTVYKNLSGYIHFSSSHLVSAVEKVDSNAHSINFKLTEIETKYSEQSWVEIVECFNESVDIFLTYLHGWIVTKAMPELVEKDGKR